MSEPKIYQTGIRGAVALANKLAKARDKDEMLRLAAANTDLEEIKRLLDEGTAIDARKGPYQTTALLEATAQGNVEVMSFLINEGADVNAVDKDGWTALMGATVQGHLDSLKLLLEHGASVNAKNNSGETALVMATRLKYSEITDHLRKYGAEQ